MARQQPNTITMTETRAGSPNGISVMRFETGKTYTTSESLAKSFVENCWAQWAVEAKMAGSAPENKMTMEATNGKAEGVLNTDAVSTGDEAVKEEKVVKRARRS